MALVWIGILVDEPLRGDDPSRGAETAIGGHARMANTLQRMQILLIADPFNGEDLPADSFGRQGMAGIEWRAIQQHAAGAAARAIAAPVCTCQAEFHRNHFPQSGARFVFGGVRLAIDQERSLFIRERNWQRCGSSY